MPLIIILKKFITHIVFPVPLFFILIILGLWFAFSRKGSVKRQKTGKLIICSTLVVFYLIATTGGLWLTLWTKQVEPLDIKSLEKQEYVIAVAGSGFQGGLEVPALHWFDEFMVTRLTQAGLIAKSFEERGYPYKLVVSIASNDPTEEKVRVLNEYFSSFSIPADKIYLVEEAYNSKMEVARFSKFSGKTILVSNAAHLPRLMRLSKKLHINSLCAPSTTRQWPDRFDITMFLPSSGNIDDFSTVVYETLGNIEVILF